MGGRLRLGLYSFVAIAMFANPLMEVVPRIVRERDVGKLPLLPYSSMTMSGIIWTTYGWFVGCATIVIINVASLVFGLVYCGVYCKFCPVDADWLPYRRRPHLVGIVAVALFCPAVILFARSIARIV